FVAVARQLLVERLQGELLALRFGQARLELAQLDLRLALRFLRLARYRARLARVVLDQAQAPGELLLRRADALARIEPEHRGERRREDDREQEQQWSSGFLALVGCFGHTGAKV